MEIFLAVIGIVIGAYALYFARKAEKSAKQGWRGVDELGQRLTGTLIYTDSGVVKLMSAKMEEKSNFSASVTVTK